MSSSFVGTFLFHINTVLLGIVIFDQSLAEFYCTKFQTSTSAVIVMVDVNWIVKTCQGPTNALVMKVTVCVEI